MRANKSVSVTLGGLTKRAEARVKSGQYASMSEVVRDGLRALDWQDAMFEDLMRLKVQEALARPRVEISPEQVALNLRTRHEARLKRDP